MSLRSGFGRRSNGHSIRRRRRQVRTRTGAAQFPSECQRLVQESSDTHIPTDDEKANTIRSLAVLLRVALRTYTGQQ